MRVELPADEINQQVESRLREMSRHARMDGFRPGKVPFKLLRNRYLNQVRHEVFGEMMESSFGQAVQQEQLRPAFRPRIEPQLDPDAGQFGYLASFEVLPSIGPISLKDAKVRRVNAEITPADLDEMLERLRKQRQTWNPVERAAQTGDRVRVAFSGTLEGGELFEGGSAEDLPLVLGSGHLIPGFEDGLVGAAAGEQRSLALTFPADYRAEHLAGKPVTFEVQVTEVAEPVLPELTADLIRSFGVPSGELEDFRQDVRKNMDRELRQRLSSQLKKSALDALLASQTLELPKVLVELEIDSLREQTAQRFGGGNKMQIPRELFTEEAQRRVGLGLLVAEVVRQNGILVDQQRVQQTIAEFASAYEDPAEVVRFYNSDRQQRATLENLVLEDQVVDWVLTQAQVEEVMTSFQDVTQGEGDA